MKNIIKRFVFFGPGLLLFSFIFLYPLIKLVTLSFQDINFFERTVSFYGIQNYITVLNDSIFLNSLKINLIFLVTVIPIITFLCFIFSILIFHSKKMMKFYQVVIFSPYILSIAVTGILFTVILQKNGPLNEFLESIGLNFIALDWLGSKKFALFTIAFIFIWREMGFGTTLFLARLLALPKDLEDAIEVDGANWLRKLIHLYLPHLKGIIDFYIIMLFISLVTNVFSYVYVINRGGPANSTTSYEYYVYTRAFHYGKLTLASAASVLVFAVLVVIIFRQVKSARVIE